MNWKEFLKLDWRKLVLFAVFAFFFIFVPWAVAGQYFEDVSWVFVVRLFQFYLIGCFISERKGFKGFVLFSFIVIAPVVISYFFIYEGALCMTICDESGNCIIYLCSTIIPRLLEIAYYSLSLLSLAAYLVLWFREDGGRKRKK